MISCTVNNQTRCRIAIYVNVNCLCGCIIMEKSQFQFWTLDWVRIKRSQRDCPSTSKSPTPVHSFHGSFHGICLQIKAMRISSLPLKSGFNTNRLTDMSSIMATKSTLEIATTNWEKYLTIYSLWVNLNFFSIREKNRTYKNCFEKGFRFPLRRVYMWDAKVLWKRR